MHFNIQGLNNKCDMLNIHLSTHNVDILCLTEHWLSRNELDCTNIKNYKLVNHYSRSNLQRGGVCIFAKKEIDISPWQYHHCLEKHFEICISVIQTEKHKIYVIVMYRTPDSDVKEFIHRLELMLYKIYNKKYLYVICGDININFFENSVHKQCLLNLLASYNIVHHVEEATRITKYSSTCIDNIFSNCSIEDVRVYNSYLSDHTYQVCTLPLAGQQKRHPQYIYKRNLNSSNIQTFQNILYQENWREMYTVDSFNEKFSTFYETLMYHYNCAFPITKIKIKNSKNWFSPQIKTLHDQLCEMEKLKKELNNPVYTDRYNEFKAIYKDTIKHFKTKINNDRIAQSDNIMRDSWKIINEYKHSSKTNSSITLTKHGERISDSVDIANEFSNFFCSLTDSSPKPNINNIIINNNVHSLYLTPTTPNEIVDIINKTTLKPAAGADDIHGRAIKSVKNLISEPLSYIINESFITGIYPDSLKISKCIPLYKNKGSREDITNYRSIHLLSQIAKIIESAYANRLTNFVVKYNLINPAQHGFRTGRSTNTAIFDLLYTICEALNGKTHIIALYYDLSRAFDSVDHQLLLHKLYGIGVRGVAYDWVASYLQNRTVSVSVGKARSDAKNSVLGVPQGSILGPLFFIIFINDITNSCTTSNKTILYADDTNLLLHHKNLDTIVVNSNLASQEIANWCSDNGLMLNPNKTFYMKFLTKNVTPDNSMLIKLCGKSIQDVQEIKFLGIYIDQKLTWEAHINNTCSKLSSISYIIRTLKETVSYNILKTLYYGLVQSTLQYGLLFWGSSSHLEKLFIMQKKIVRCMVNAHPHSSCKPNFKNLEILTLPCLYISQLIMYIRSNEHQFLRNNDIHPHGTRNNHLIYHPFSRLNIGKNFPTYIGIKCYNKIDFFETNDSINACKYKLNRFLIENAFYSVDEFLNH